jgi:DNA-binding transcriptional ArsR family regulator
MAYAEAIQALADPTRRAVFERLRTGPQSVGKLADGLDVTRPAVSQHLKVLEGAGLVKARRDGARRIYSVEIQGLRELRQYLDGFWDDVLEAFRAAAESEAPASPAFAAPRTATQAASSSPRSEVPARSRRNRKVATDRSYGRRGPKPRSKHGKH